jgi:hypothetical protein
MPLFIIIQNKRIPFFITTANLQKQGKVIEHLKSKLTNGKRLIQSCVETLISIEIVGSEAILHTFDEENSLELSLF